MVDEMISEKLAKNCNSSPLKKVGRNVDTRIPELMLKNNKGCVF